MSTKQETTQKAPNQTTGLSDAERIHRATQRYHAAAHAMQSAVTTELGLDGPNTAACSPKHLRVGINSAFVSHQALVELLLKKKIISDVEYYEAQAEAMEKEVERYKQIFRERGYRFEFA